MRKSIKCPYKIIAHSLVKYMAAMAGRALAPMFLHSRQYGNLQLGPGDEDGQSRTQSKGTQQSDICLLYLINMIVHLLVFWSFYMHIFM
jgi:hypothetical protein